LKRPVFSITCALALAAVVIAAGIASAAGSKVFGAGDADLKPLCEKTREGTCFVVGSLTTFINRLGDKKHPFTAPSDGRIVAWSIELGHKPSGRPPKDDPDAKSNLEFFQDLFGNERYGKGPVARLAILKRQQGVQFKLVDQSPAVKLSGPFYHADTVITLERPIPIRKGEVVGLSSLTWVPMLKPHRRGDGKNSWRASLAKGECNEAGIINGKPQKKVGTVRDYACEFDDRLFYKAYFVPNNN
jgi:hypothetical protein